jgi:nitronate monooxygenase
MMTRPAKIMTEPAMTNIAKLFGVRFPIVQAPMAGGPNTAELVSEVSRAGGLGSIAGAYFSPEEISEQIAKVRATVSAPFAVNLFAPVPIEPYPPAVASAAAVILDGFRAELGLPLGTPPPPVGDRFHAQLEAVLRGRPDVFSFTFGCLTPEALRALRARSIVAVGTATNLEEALVLQDAGVDAICAQGAEAGGHRGTFLGRFEDALIGNVALVRQIVGAVRVPVLAAGGIMDGWGMAAAMSLGASGVQLGTAFLGCPEAGTSRAHREALRSEAARRTVITRAFSGRPARGIRNRVTDAFEGKEVPPFPGHQATTRDLRAAAERQGRGDLMQLWAGQGAPLVRELPAAELVETLARELREATILHDRGYERSPS